MNRSNGIEALAVKLIEAYERGETCPPATEAALRDALPANPACPLSCPFRVRGSVRSGLLKKRERHSPIKASM